MSIEIAFFGRKSERPSLFTPIDMHAPHVAMRKVYIGLVRDTLAASHTLPHSNHFESSG